MSLAERCSREFFSKIRNRGAQYFQEGRVSLSAPEGQAIRARVAGTLDEYELKLDWSNIQEGFLTATCTCPHFEGGNLCKHIWAAILAADQENVIGNLPGRKRLLIEGEDDADADQDELHDLLGGTLHASHLETIRRQIAGRSRTRRTPARRSSRRSDDWRRQLEAVSARSPQQSGVRRRSPSEIKTREPWFVLDVTSSLHAGALVINLFQRETRRGGEFGKIKRLSLNRNDIERFTHPQDRELLTLLLLSKEPTDSWSAGYRYSYYGYEPATSEITPSAVSHAHVLPQLCATGRFVWQLDSKQPVEENGRPITWDEGEPWRFQLHAADDEKKRQWALTGRLIRPGETEAVSLDRPVLLLSRGLVLFEDRLARLEAAGHFPWVALLRQAGSVRVPYKDRQELLERLWQAPTVPEMVLPDNLRWEETHVPPRGRFSVHPPRNNASRMRLYADIALDYEGRTVPAASDSAGIVDAEHERILVRDKQAEEELLRSVGELGLHAVEGYSHLQPNADVHFPERRLPEVVDALLEAGWIVEAEGHPIRQPGELRMSVTSGVDWFELDGEIDFDGVKARLPDLLAALRHGDKYVRLGDGSQGLLPRDWLARYGGLANLGEPENGTVRFRPSQALLLDSLLSAQKAQKQIAVDRKFSGLRRRLRSFEGVSPRGEPRGFTGKLREYQKEGLGWLHFLRNFGFGGCLADDMGLGKTVQVLALLESRRTRRMPAGRRRTPSLVVVPRSLVFNWLEEAARFTPRLRILNYTGRDRAEALKRLDDYDLVVTTYGTLRRDILKLKEVRFDYAVLDESQAIKNANSQNAKACRLLDAEHRLAMTGTPVENHLGELWSLFEFLNPGMLGRSSAFQTISKQASSTGNGDSTALLSRGLAPFILRRTKQQVLTELPEKVEQTLHCELSGKQRKQYRELRDYYRSRLTKRVEQSGLAKSKIHVLEALLRLRQAACHPGLLDKNKVDEESAKLETLLEQLDEVLDEGHKVLVFSQFTSLLAILRRRLDKRKIVYEYLDGRTRKRQEKVRRFQDDPACPLFLISLKAGGHGLNLTAADYVFILDPWWNPAVEAQAVDRAHRIGQTRRVLAYRLIARDTVEEKILELQQRKRHLADAIVSSDGSLLRTLNTEDLQLLLS